MHDERGLQHALESRTGTRIEIEMEVVGAVDIVAARVPLVQIDAAEVDHPQKRRQVLDHRKVDDSARSVRYRADLDPGGTRRRRPLHEEERTGGAVRVALHDHGAVVQVRQQDVGHVRVVLQQIALGQLQIGPEDLSQVGQVNAATGNVQDDVVGVARNPNRRWPHARIARL